MNTLVVVETFIAFVIAVTLHEAAHAAMAGLLGDGVSWSAGRMSLNPRRQMAAIGSIVAITLSFGIPLGGLPVGLGWGKPVEIDTRRMRVRPDTGVFLVALAGPVFSLAMGFLFAVILRFMPGYQALALFSGRCAGATGSILQVCLSHAQPVWQLRLEQFLFVLAATNVLIALLNLIPLHPLDGYGMLFALLPNGPAVRYRDFQPYMEVVLLVIFFLIPYVLELLGLSQLNPGFWLGFLAQMVTGGITGPIYPTFIYQL
ncbi:MAG TPA: site-2 protease family protein [Ktedonobacterales bacterium]|jgi:Zn-dependent protease|nr:site-2 protease family protein [Ktedonobacterales bacterium]